MNSPAETMTAHVDVECFGMLQQVCGGRARRVALTDGPATVADVLQALVRDIPGLQRYLPYTACAIGDRIVARNEAIVAGQTLVLLPPVSGG